MSDLEYATNALNSAATRAENTTDFFDDVTTLGPTSTVKNPNNNKTVPSVQKQVKDLFDSLPADDSVDALEAAAIAVGAKYEEVIATTNTTTVLDDVLYIYDASEQVAYAKPSDVGAGEVVVSVVDGVLTTDEGGVYELLLARSGERLEVSSDDLLLKNLQVGTLITITDRGYAKYDISTGTPNGIDKIDVGGGKVATYSSSYKTAFTSYFGSKDEVDASSIISRMFEIGIIDVIVDTDSKMSAEIIIPINSTLSSLGGRTLTASSGFSGSQIISSVSNGISIFNINIDGNGENCRVATLTGVNSLNINNVSVYNTRKAGVVITSTSGLIDGVKIENLSISSVSTDSSDGGRGGLYASLLTRASIKNVSVSSSGGKGVAITDSVGNSVSDIYVNGILDSSIGLYLARGNGNIVTNVNTDDVENPVKFSRGEEGSSVTGGTLNTSLVNVGEYGNGVLMQGSIDCRVESLIINVSGHDGIRIEQHPDPEGSDSHGNLALNCKVNLSLSSNVGAFIYNNISASPNYTCYNNSIVSCEITSEAESSSQISVIRCDGALLHNNKLSGLANTGISSLESNIRMTSNEISHQGAGRAVIVQANTAGKSTTFKGNDVDYGNNTSFGLEFAGDGALYVNSNEISGSSSVYGVRVRNSTRAVICNNDILEGNVKPSMVLDASVTGGLVNANSHTGSLLNQGGAILGVNYEL